MKQSLMLKLLAISTISATLFANSIDNKIIELEKKRVASNKGVEVKNIEIINKFDLKDIKGFSAYVLKVDLNYHQDANKTQEMTVTDILYSDGKYVTFDIVNIDSLKSVREEINPNIDKSFYSNETFIAGSKNAKNKMLLFSDPLCYFCKDNVPDIIKDVEDNSKDFALYMYHFPITTIHPASPIIIKAMFVAEKNGMKMAEIVKKIYKSEFNAKETNEDLVLAEVNKVLGTKISKADISKKEIDERYKADILVATKLLVGGTPTLFVNDKKDNTKQEYKALIGKK